MNHSILYTSEFIEITKRDDGFYIQSFKNGMGIDQFNKLMGLHPEIHITSFFAIKNALLSAPKPPSIFGDIKERVFVEVSSDELSAFVTLNVLDIEFTGDRKSALVREVIKALKDQNIVFGLKHEIILNELKNSKPILVAEGIPPVNGADATITMYVLEEVKPNIKEDGNVDHYELNLINKVNAGDWLGERLDPTSGTPGKSVKGKAIPSLPGKMYPLMFDRKTVKEVYENGKTTLYALKNGAVHYDGDRIGISNFLQIDGNVDFKTGNIDFDGYLTVKGSIADNFSVSADKDIEILGEYGVGSVKEISSNGGNIYIKGGIAGKNRAIIRSTQNVYTKFVSDATVICEGSVHIGFYCLNSNITAKEVILDSVKGQIIGGNIQAEIKVVSSIYGNASEKKTMVTVTGFNRAELKTKLERLIKKVEKAKADLIVCKQELSIYSSSNQLTKEQMLEYERINRSFFDLRDDLKKLEDEGKMLAGYLRTHGEGEIVIMKKAFPGTILEIKKQIMEIRKIILSTSYYLQDGSIKEL